MVLRLLAFVAGLLATAGAYAQTCTVPYTLTNGTIADATQVMANFNALAACTNSVLGGTFGSGIAVSVTGSPVFTVSNTKSYHEGTGATTTFNQHVQVNSDHIKLESSDLSLYTAATFTGTPTTGERPGFDWAVPGAPATFQVRYTVQSSDTNDSIALGVCNAINTTPGLMAALGAYTGGGNMGYRPIQTTCTFQQANSAFRFDYPWAASGSSITPVNTTHTTVTICSPLLSGCQAPRMDGGPFLVATKDFPASYTVGNGDQGPVFYLEVLRNGSYEQVASIAPQYVSGTAVKTVFNNAGASNLAFPIFDMQNGVNLYSSAGDRCVPSDDRGLLSTCVIRANDYFIGNDAAQTINRDGSGHTVMMAQIGKDLILASNQGSGVLRIMASQATSTMPLRWPAGTGASISPGIGADSSSLILTGGGGGITFNAANNMTSTFGVDNSGNVNIPQGGITAHLLPGTTAGAGRRAVCIDGTTGLFYQSSTASC